MPIHIADDFAAIRERQAEMRPEPIATTGQDAAVLTLWRDWLDACAASDAVPDEDEDRSVAAAERIDSIEDRIFALPADPAGLAVRAYLFLCREHSYWTPRCAELRIPANNVEYRDGLAGTLRAAAAIVPEIEELAAAVIHPDAALIDAEMTLLWRERCWPVVSERNAHVQKEAGDALLAISATPAKTPRGEAIKAKWTAAKGDLLAVAETARLADQIARLPIRARGALSRALDRLKAGEDAETTVCEAFIAAGWSEKEARREARAIVERARAR